VRLNFLSLKKMRRFKMKKFHLVAILGLGVLSLVNVASAFASGTTTLAVPASAPATDTGVDIPSPLGTAVIVRAIGKWDVCNGGCPSGPDGSPTAFASCPGIDPASAPAGKLLGSLDGGSTFFIVGSGPTAIPTNTLPTTLSLGPNDCGNYADNTGALTATVIVYPINKDSCKKGGWQYLSRQNGTAFKNQGSCVSYVNTGK
jgi:hypothetical protein